MYVWILVFLTPVITRSVFSEPSGCGTGQHWVSTYHRRTYTRGDGTSVRDAEVKAHCHGDPVSYREWNSKLREGRPPGWFHPKEQSQKWSTEEKERVLEALSETPEPLRDSNIQGIYRM